MRVANYARVSTKDQDLQRQIENTTEYAQSRLDADLGEIQVYRDKSTGTDTERSGYEEMMTDAAAGEFDAVVVNSVSRISRSIRDLDRTAERLAEHDVELHIIAEGLTIRPDEDDPYQTAMFQLLGVFAELEAAMIRQRVREGIASRHENEEYHHGPAPLGFKKNDGRLVEAENFDRVRTALEMVANDELSKRKAANELETSRRTINRALDRAELYAL